MTSQEASTTTTTSTPNTMERAISEVPAPLWVYIPKTDLFADDGTIKVNNLKQHLLKEGRLSPQDAIELIKRAAAVFRQEANLLQIQDPVSVCGDVHGQYFDLLKLLEVGGDPGDNKYLFLGDYVDRGYFGSEVCFLLLSYKINFPNAFFMLRGNHECRHLTAYFNFKQECLYKYNQEVYDTFMDCFDCLPLAALLNGRFLCVHGGLSPEIKTIDEINSIDRFREPPSSGPMWYANKKIFLYHSDLLWSDPMDDEEEDSNPDATFLQNELRGCSYVFSYNAVSQFLKQNHLLSVIRAHEAQDEGYRLYKASPTTKFPTVICIFSAPNYCDAYNNKGAIIRFQNNLMNIRQFNYSPHPYYLPNFMNAFNWSLPFVVEKVMDIFQTILNLCDPAEDAQEEEVEPVDNNAPLDKERAQAIKLKIRTVGRLCRMYTTLREEHESIVMLKGLAGGQIPQGLLQQGPQAIKSAVLDFNTAKQIDKQNEKRPQVKIAEDALISKSVDAKEKEILLQKMKETKIQTAQPTDTETIVNISVEKQ